MKIAFSLTLCIIVCVIGILGILFCADAYSYYRIFNADTLSGSTVLGVMDYATLAAAPYRSSTLGVNYLGITAYDFATSYEQPCTIFHRPNVLDYQRFEYRVLGGEIPGVQCVGMTDYQQFLGEHDYATARGLLIAGIVLGSLFIVGAGVFLAIVLVREKRSRAATEEDRVPIMSDQHQSVQ